MCPSISDSITKGSELDPEQSVAYKRLSVEVRVKLELETEYGIQWNRVGIEIRSMSRYRIWRLELNFDNGTEIESSSRVQSRVSE